MKRGLIIKLCGMRDPDNIRRAEQLDIDWMGFIFWKKSKRYAADCLSYLPLSVRRIGVFVNADLDEIISAVNAFHLGGVQLHGCESPDFCRALRQSLPSDVFIIKAIAIASEADAISAKNFDKCVDYLLFDTKCDGFGGCGNSFDWSFLEAYDGSTPFFLSGGIGIDSINAIHCFYHPRLAGIDINSRFEISPAIKDIELVKDFLNTL